MTVVCVPVFTQRDIDVLDIQSLYSGYCVVKHYSFKFKRFEGEYSNPIQREVVIRTPAAAVLLYDPIQDVVVLIEQMRIGALEDPVSPWLLEVVAGVLDEEEPYEECAHREAIEEAGHAITRLIPILDYWVSPGTSNEKTRLFCGLVKTNTDGTYYGVREEGEDIKIHIIPSKEAFALVPAGKITTAPAIIALQWLELNRSSLFAESLDSQDTLTSG